MKKAALPLALLLLGTALSGCPIYDHDDAGCYESSDCAPGYSCDDRTGTCFIEDSNACRRPSDCGANETCSRAGSCVAGDCHFASVGCVQGYECSSESGLWECVARDVSPGGSGGAPSEGGAPSAGGAAGASSGAAGDASAGEAGAGGAAGANGGAGG